MKKDLLEHGYIKTAKKNGYLEKITGKAKSNHKKKYGNKN